MRSSAILLAVILSCSAGAASAQGTPPATPPAPAPPAPPPAGAQPWGDLSSGGLTPPAPLAPTQPTRGSGTAVPVPPPDIGDDLDDSKEDDAGRGLSWFWLEAEGGFEHIGLQTFNVDEAALSAGFVETEASGGAVSAGLGAQLVFLTIGARGRMGLFDAWQIGRVGGELGLRIPVGFVEPRFDIGAGYAALGQFDGVVAEEISIEGFYVRGGAGVDFYPVDILALGLHATFDFMGLTRPGLDPERIEELRGDPQAGSIDDAQAELLALEGSGYGAGFALQGSIGLHF